MRRVSLRGSSGRLRARRWDVVVLGSALPGWVAAVRLGMQRLRVLVLAEDAAEARAPSLREPFFVPAAGHDGLLDAVLRELAMPLIDRHRLAEGTLSYQVALPAARIAVGEPALTASELVSWGLAKPETARSVVRELAEAAAAERDALLAAPLVRAAGLRARARTATTRPRAPRHARGLPEVAARPPAALRALFDAQVRAVGHHAPGTPVAPEARARVLGAALAGGVSWRQAEHGLEAMLRRRLAGLHGELRTLRGPFSLVQVEDAVGVAPRERDEMWLGRALLVNTAPALLGAAFSAWGEPVARPLAAAPAPSHRLVRLRLAAAPEILPEGMGERVVAASPAGEGEPRVTTLRRAPGGEDAVELVASAVAPADEAAAAETRAHLEATARDLMPFSGSGLAPLEAAPTPAWDDPDAICPPAGRAAGWPGELEPRLSSRPRLWCLPREPLAPLGVEGDLVLGWRVGEALAAELE